MGVNAIQADASDGGVNTEAGQQEQPSPWQPQLGRWDAVGHLAHQVRGQKGPAQSAEEGTCELWS